ncbi:GGDEF domain-containing protein [Desulfurivibrio dismutans]|uniref:GGDEF domain-containing protein n=1 Tax=Desulfurivibrio dismutans TaxID=1398908 RepID=UPI0023DA0D43|nr:sensor domain-containing diguanylate cyclase [Desulfurivibrio alkaliphilus]MDF1615517.1 sensor domain-containing diguanylate cyclase [Desulfurivibrio alkaliphilus]
MTDPTDHKPDKSSPEWRLARLERENRLLRQGIRQGQRMKELWLKALDDLQANKEELARRNRRLTTLQQVSAAISETLVQDELFRRIMDAMARLIELDEQWPLGIFLVEPDGSMRLAAQRGVGDRFIVAHRKMQVGKCLCGLAARGEIVISERCVVDPRRTIDPGPMPEHGHLILPLRSKERVVGVFFYYLPPGRVIKQAELETFLAVGNQVGLAIENARLYETVRRLSIYDPLTGLYNHGQFYSLLEEELSRHQRTGLPLALLMLDIDHFKKVNDTYGHRAGDAILRQLSRLLQKEARTIDRVCRYGGEELALILPDTDLEAARKAAERLRRRVEELRFITCDQREIRLTVSIGAAACTETEAEAESLVNSADRALYAAKRAGRNRVYPL